MRPPSDQLLKAIDEAKQLIYEHFQIKINAEISICTIDEMTNRLQQSYAPKTPVFEKIRPLIPYLDGKYFKEDQEIWLIEGRGEKDPNPFSQRKRS